MESNYIVSYLFILLLLFILLIFLIFLSGLLVSLFSSPASSYLFQSLTMPLSHHTSREKFINFKNIISMQSSSFFMSAEDTPSLWGCHSSR